MEIYKLYKKIEKTLEKVLTLVEGYDIINKSSATGCKT